MFIWIPKINFIIHFFFEILHFKESCNLIGWQLFGPLLDNQNFSRYGIASEISTTILISILDYLQEKLMTPFFKKSKKPYFESLLPKFGQKRVFLEERTLSVYRYSNYLRPCRKSEKTIEPFLRKMLKWRTDGRTDRQTGKRWFYRTLCRMGVQHLDTK